MAKANPLKIGSGSALILIGIYLTFSNFNASATIAGIALIAGGLAILASN